MARAVLGSTFPQHALYVDWARGRGEAARAETKGRGRKGRPQRVQRGGGGEERRAEQEGQGVVGREHSGHLRERENGVVGVGVGSHSSVSGREGHAPHASHRIGFPTYLQPQEQEEVEMSLTSDESDESDV